MCSEMKARAAAGISPPPYHSFTISVTGGVSLRERCSILRTFGRYVVRSTRCSRYAANTAERGNGIDASAERSMRRERSYTRGAGSSTACAEG